MGLWGSSDDVKSSEQLEKEHNEFVIDETIYNVFEFIFWACIVAAAIFASVGTGALTGLMIGN
jgi:hypothetical protein